MPRKRASPVRAPPSSRARGRPKRNTRSTYASNDEDQLEEEPLIEQPPASEVQDPTPERETQAQYPQYLCFKWWRPAWRGTIDRATSGVGGPRSNTRPRASTIAGSVAEYAVGKGHSSRGLRCKPASGSNIGIGSGDQAAARPPTSGDTEHVASATPLRHFTPNTLHKLEPTQSSASDSSANSFRLALCSTTVTQDYRPQVSTFRRHSNLTMASILQANNIVQVQWKVRPAPIHYELRSSSSLRRGEWICPILIFRHSSGGWCAGLVLYAQAKHSILMGKPLR
jgi:hypothetical protein